MHVSGQSRRFSWCSELPKFIRIYQRAALGFPNSADVPMNFFSHVGHVAVHISATPIRIGSTKNDMPNVSHGDCP